MHDLVRHKPIWSDDRETAQYPPLTSNLSIDVAVIGGGITGVTTALLLKRSGLRVALVTGGRLGSGTTGATTAHLSSLPDLDLITLTDKFGVDAARLTLGSLQAAIYQIQTLAAEVGPSAQFQSVPGFRFTETPDGIDQLRNEAIAAQELGLTHELNFTSDLPFRILACLRIENQAIFHPLHYLDGLATLIPGNGSYIFENSHVEHFEDGSPSRVYTQRGELSAHSIVLSTHSPVGVFLPLHTRVSAYQSYVMAFEAPAMQTLGTYFDTSQPYFYLRPLSAQHPQTWIVGGCDHHTGQIDDTEKMFDLLESYIRVRFDRPRLLYRWSNELFTSVDGLPYIGKIPFRSHLYTATGFAGVGMTFGTLAAQINSDLILGRTNQYAEIYSPSRVKPLASGWRFAKENLNVFRWYIGDRVSASEHKSLEDISRGEGQLITLAGKKYAIYCDDHGFLHVFSPACTHMGGTVHWNAAERTWDCPLHGGRYRCTGQVFEGPPLQDLSTESLHLPEPGNPILEDPGPIPLRP
jgi:glycine/D-amino acid oxidase-like deaminating enzyme/nitrite reductase/ring-hydroxylating ferredoxin subunit